MLFQEGNQQPKFLVIPFRRLGRFPLGGKRGGRLGKSGRKALARFRKLLAKGNAQAGCAVALGV